MGILEYFLSCLFTRPRLYNESSEARFIKLACLSTGLVILGYAVVN